MRCVLSLGSNLGDSEGELNEAIERLTELGEVIARSSMYRTAPWGPTDQPDFVNCVVILETELDPLALLGRCHEIEDAFHRTRELRWGPRTLDIDIVTYGEVVSESPELTLPHPRAQLRAFVLVPWLEIDPGATLPDVGRVAELALMVREQGIEKLS